MKRQGKTAAPVPMGKALDTDDAALDLESLITPADIEAAKADAARNMTRRGLAMLDAARAETPPDEERPV